MQRTAIIASRAGLHARPASVFASAASSLTLDVMIRLAGQPEAEAIPAGSILSVMTLGAAHGDEIILNAEGGPEAESALQVLVELLESELDSQE